MGADPDLAELKVRVEPFLDRVLGVYLWGSAVQGRASARSDIDLCVVAGPDVDARDALRAAWVAGRLVDSRYDVHVFEELPLYLQGEMLDAGILIASRDEARLGEYLRMYRKIWDDQSIRRHGPEEIERLLAARRARADV